MDFIISCNYFLVGASFFLPSRLSAPLAFVSVCLSVCPPGIIIINLSGYPTPSPFTFPPLLHPSVYLSVYLPVCLFVCKSTAMLCLLAYLSISFPVYLIVTMPVFFFFLFEYNLPCLPPCQYSLPAVFLLICLPSCLSTVYSAFCSRPSVCLYVCPCFLPVYLPVYPAVFLSVLPVSLAGRRASGA